MKVEPEAVSGMKVGCVFRDNEAPVNSLDFSDDGEVLVTGGDDETLHVYLVGTAAKRMTLLSRKYGIDLVRFTHSKDAVVCASKNGWDESLRYLNLHDNTYLRYFKGHRDRVVSLAVNPASDALVSASVDGTARMWDLRQSSSTALLRLPVQGLRPVACFDNTGKVLAVVVGNEFKLFDARKLESGAFSTCGILAAEGTSGTSWGSIQTSDDGKFFLLSTLGGDTRECCALVLDAFASNGADPVKTRLRGINNVHSLVVWPSFSPVGARFVTCGSEDGTIQTWDTLTGTSVASWSGHPGPVSCVRWNPKSFLLASSCTNVALWIPDLTTPKPTPPSVGQPQPPPSVAQTH